MSQILIVEDNELNRELLQDILDGNRISWLSATSGHQALEILREHEVQLVLVDLQMPGMDGFQTLAEIRKLLGEKSPPAIAITGNAMEIDRQRCLDSGFSDFLKKPFRIQNFLLTIDKYLT